MTFPLAFLLPWQCVCFTRRHTHSAVKMTTTAYSATAICLRFHIVDSCGQFCSGLQYI